MSLDCQVIGEGTAAEREAADARHLQGEGRPHQAVPRTSSALNWALCMIMACFCTSIEPLA